MLRKSEVLNAIKHIITETRLFLIKFFINGWKISIGSYTNNLLIMFF
jgi:hypothetical protein